MDDGSLINFWGNDWLVVAFIALVVVIAGVWRTFEKAGKPGWACIIPFYNVIVLLEIVGKPWWWLLLMIFVPLGQIIWVVWTLNLVSLSFGKNQGFTVGLYFLSAIFWPILGFGNAEYKGPAGAGYVM